MSDPCIEEALRLLEEARMYITTVDPETHTKRALDNAFNSVLSAIKSLTNITELQEAE